MSTTTIVAVLAACAIVGFLGYCFGYEDGRNKNGGHD